MTRDKKALLFVNDFADRGAERFYLSFSGMVAEVSAEEVVTEEEELVCHDYWLIAPALYKRTNSLPKRITDVEELRISTSGKREDRENRDTTDVYASLLDSLGAEAIGRYKNIVFKSAAFDADTFVLVGAALLSLSDRVEADAQASDEWDRYLTIERPIADYLIRSAANGIAIDSVSLRRHKEDIEFLYYMTLKNFSARYSLPLEVPSDEDVMEYLAPRGFDFSGVGVEYILNFVPMQDGFSDRLLELRKIANSRWTLNSIPLSQKRIFPIVDSFGSITSRIYYKDPSLQNLAKRHRDILTADEGMKLSYVDFGQYEAGIMGALSGDEKMLALFASGDLYTQVSQMIFSDASKRKHAKRLFLSYAYGMKRKGLIDAAFGLGARRDAAKNFFNQFSQFENWKSGIWAEFLAAGRVGTALGNYLARSSSGDLSEKEKRSAVSQVVQGTASLIFKKALLGLNLVQDVQLKVPMHDAVLFQHPKEFDPTVVASLFSKVLTDHFNGRINGKASVESFTQN
jgi:DNA polymerase I